MDHPNCKCTWIDQQAKRDLIQTGKNLLAIVLLALVVFPLTAIAVFAWFVSDFSDWAAGGVLVVTDGLREQTSTRESKCKPSS